VNVYKDIISVLLTLGADPDQFIMGTIRENAQKQLDELEANQHIPVAGRAIVAEVLKLIADAKQLNALIKFECK
jgi:hypothetical protein